MRNKLRTRIGSIFFGPMLLAFASTAAPAEIEVLGAEATKKLNLPFSEAVAVGDMLYLSGQIGNRPGELTVVKGGIQSETRQTMKNIFGLLKKYGSSPEKIVKCTIFLADMNEWDDMNIAYIKALGEHRPARSALGASGLALNSKVEIECIAVR